MKRKDDPSTSGVLLIDKPAGMTSHDVVGRVRKCLGMRRVGHGGTLDPMATGVLVVGVGPTTRLLGIVGAHDKEYEATIRLGSATTTDDREGDVVTSADESTLSVIGEELIVGSIGRFVGTIQQRPSAVSAVKVDGKRAYDRVRAGEDVELPERTVSIAAFDVLAVHRSAEHIDIDVRVECSAGTYIRALARDLGADLGVGGHLTALRRTRSGAVRVTECIDLEAVGIDRLMNPGTFARQELPSIDISEPDAVRARQGSPLPLSLPESPVVALIGPGEDLVAVVAVSGGSSRYQAVFPAVGGSATLG
jgi:tRNA pseudouridine55 synthase